MDGATDSATDCCAISVISPEVPIQVVAATKKEKLMPIAVDSECKCSCTANGAMGTWSLGQ